MPDLTKLSADELMADYTDEAHAEIVARARLWEQIDDAAYEIGFFQLNATPDGMWEAHVGTSDPVEATSPAAAVRAALEVGK